MLYIIRLILVIILISYIKVEITKKMNEPDDDDYSIHLEEKYDTYRTNGTVALQWV